MFISTLWTQYNNMYISTMTSNSTEALQKCDEWKSCFCQWLFHMKTFSLRNHDDHASLLSRIW